MTKRINLTLTDGEYSGLLACYKHFIQRFDGNEVPPTITGYTLSLVLVTVNRIMKEEGLRQ